MEANEDFETVGDGRFLCRNGAAWRDGQAFSRRKLLLFSTRRELLARHLLRLSRRLDCVSVEFASSPRGGIHSGRACFLTDEAVGEVWARYQSHPSLSCTAVDDEFIERFGDAVDCFVDLWLDEDHTVEDRETLLMEAVPAKGEP